MYARNKWGDYKLFIEGEELNGFNKFTDYFDNGKNITFLAWRTSKLYKVSCK